MSVRSSTVLQQEGSTEKKNLRWLFKAITTVVDHKLHFYDTVNQMNGGGWLSTFNPKLSNQIKHVTSVFN